MSWRQAAAPARAAQAAASAIARTRRDRLLRVDVIHPSRPEALEQAARLGGVELRILGFDAEEEPVDRSALAEALHVEDRVVRLREAAQHQRADDRGQRRQENRGLERRDDERRQADERAAADVQRIAAQVDAADAQVPANQVHVQLEPEAEAGAEEAAGQNQLL